MLSQLKTYRKKLAEFIENKEHKQQFDNYWRHLHEEHKRDHVSGMGHRDGGWWDRLTPEAQQKYINEHKTEMKANPKATMHQIHKKIKPKVHSHDKEIKQLNKIFSGKEKNVSTIYHANTHGKPSTRPVEDDFNSIGTWFSNDKDYSASFGEHLHEYTPPESNVKIIKDADNTEFEKTFFDKDIVNSMFSEKVAEALEHYSDGNPKVPLTNKMKKEVKAYAKKNPINNTRDLFYNLLMYNKDYLEKFQKSMKDEGYEGLFFPDSEIDGHDHDVWIMFHPEEMKGNQIENPSY